LPQLGTVRTRSAAIGTRHRIGGRTRLQQEQKDATRERLLRAAQEVFAERSYAGTPVEEIIRRAGASRTSFYRHFDGKWSLASALCAEIMPSVWLLWTELSSHASPSEQQIIDWLERRIALYRSHRSLFETLKEAVAIEPVGLAAINQTHDETIRLLAAGIPAFSAALEPGPAGEEINIRAHLLLMQLDEFNYVMAIRGWQVDRGLATRVMAQHFRRFVAECGSIIKRARPRNPVRAAMRR
jgi:AcrR family transcriptional regulator